MSNLDLIDASIRAQIALADLEAMRLEQLASASGALAGEYRLVWRFARVRGFLGLWPFLG